MTIEIEESSGCVFDEWKVTGFKVVENPLEWISFELNKHFLEIQKNIDKILLRLEIECKATYYDSKDFFISKLRFYDKAENPWDITKYITHFAYIPEIFLKTKKPDQLKIFY
jgi:adenine-specific DNA methylase